MILLTYISHILPCRLSYFSQYISLIAICFLKNNQPYFTDQTTTFYAQSIY